MSVIAPETSEQVYRALGEAVAKHWSRLPHDLQRLLFKQATSSEREQMRPSLAVILHDQHPRTCAAIRSQAILEPDSLGG
jgi:glucose-6-phosphate-specific signal transduction histidine kinase